MFVCCRHCFILSSVSFLYFQVLVLGGSLCSAQFGSGARTLQQRRVIYDQQQDAVIPQVQLCPLVVNGPFFLIPSLVAAVLTRGSVRVELHPC